LVIKTLSGNTTHTTLDKSNPGGTSGCCLEGLKHLQGLAWNTSNNIPIHPITHTAQQTWSNMFPGEMGKSFPHSIPSVTFWNVSIPQRLRGGSEEKR